MSERACRTKAHLPRSGVSRHGKKYTSLTLEGSTHNSRPLLSVVKTTAKVSAIGFDGLDYASYPESRTSFIQLVYKIEIDLRLNQ